MPGLALRVNGRLKKSFYASYRISKGIDQEGSVKSTGRYKFICRVGEQPISVVKVTITLNIIKWNLESTTSIGDDVAALSKDFRFNVLNGYRIKKKKQN